MRSQGIRDIAGAFCPMGCGESLHLMASGLILCLDPHCEKPDAAQQILGERESDHIVTFTADDWDIIHPLRDRLGRGLLACPVHEACKKLPGPPAGIAGKYRVRMDSEGGLEVELLDAGNSQS